jgi:hypothetical protein
MTTTKLFTYACIAAFAVIVLPAGQLPAQSLVEPAAIGVSLQNAIITSESGATRQLNTYLGLVGRLGLAPNQVVTVTLQFPEDLKNETVFVGLLDGGEINPRQLDPDPITIKAGGTASFIFQGGNAVGLYRLEVRVKEEEYRLEFRVIDPVNLQNNPPRLQILY